MLTAQRWGLMLAIGIAILAALATPKLLPLLNDNDAPAENTSRKALRVTTHRVVPVDLSERLAAIGTVRADESVEIVSEMRYW